MRTKTPAQSEKILNVAVRLFATHRFHEARMDDIAAAAGVGKGTLYRYFNDKDELYVALLDRAAVQLSELLMDTTARPGDPPARLEAIVDTILSYFDKQPHVFDLVQHAEALHRPEQRFPWQTTRSLSIDLTTEILEEGNRTGVFRIPDVGLATLMLLGGLRAIIRFGDKPRPPDLARRLIDNFVFGAVHPEPSSATTNGHGRKRVAPSV